MARRSGKKGQWLASDDYTGMTVYARDLRLDYWGNYAVNPLKRNLQEISSPLNDPQPVPFYRGPTYEQTTAGQFDIEPAFVGLTTVPTPPSFAGEVMGYSLGIGNMAVGTAFLA